MMRHPDLFLLAKDERWAPGVRVKAQSYRKVNDVRVLADGLVVKAGSNIWLVEPDKAQLICSHDEIKGAIEASFTRLMYCCRVAADTVTGFAFSGGDWTVRFDQPIFRLIAQDDRVYVGTRETIDGPGSLFVLDIHGNLLWRHDYAETSAFQGVRGMPYHIAPAHEWGVVATAFMELLYLFECRSGRLLWIVSSEGFRKRIDIGVDSAYGRFLSSWLDGFSAGNPIGWIAFNPRKPSMTIGAEGGTYLLSFDLKGDLIWRVELPGTCEFESSTMALYGQHARNLLVAGSYGGWWLYDDSGQLLDKGKLSEMSWEGVISDDGCWFAMFDRNKTLHLVSLTDGKVFSRNIPSCRAIGTLGSDLALWDRYLYILEIDSKEFGSGTAPDQ